MKLSPTLPLLFLLFLLGSCRGGSPEGAGGPPPTPVKFATVQQQTIEETSEFVASLGSRQFATLSPQVSGQVSKVFVQLGDQVAAGAPILQVDPAQQQAAVNSRSAAMESARSTIETTRANLNSAQAELQNRKADLDYKKSLYDRQAQLAKEGAISQDSLDQYDRDLKQAQASVSAQEGTIRAQQALIAGSERDMQAAEANAQQEEVQLRYYQVLAPFGGTVGDVQVKIGDYVTPQTVLTTISQSQPLEVSLSIPLDRATQIRIGTPIQLLDGQNKVIGTSQVSFISPQADSNTQAVLVKALYDNTGQKLRAQQFIRTRVVWNKRPSLVIPMTAISRVAGQDFVYVVAPAPPPQNQAGQGQSPESKQPPQNQPPGIIATQKAVELGAIQGNTYQVLSGLQVNEQIVVSGLQKLYDGAAIMDESQLPKGPPGGSPGG